MIETENLSKVYGTFKALDNLNLTIEKNDVFGFLGPNGAGKTTTINLLMGMLQPTSGRIKIAGIDVLKNPLDVKKICGYMPENPGFYDNLTARQNLQYFLQFYDKSKENSEDLLEMVGLGDFADKKVGGFSKGMKQRLGMAQALLNDPEVIFLDEPTAGLDPMGVSEFRDIIKKLKEEGKTIFFSSHILSEVKEVCDTIGILFRGKLVIKRSIKDLIKNNFRLLLETDPKLNISLIKPFISKVEFNGSSALILNLEDDYRIDISKVVSKNGYLIKEMHLIEDLEEIYLKAVQK